MTTPITPIPVRKAGIWAYLLIGISILCVVCIGIGALINFSRAIGILPTLTPEIPTATIAVNEIQTIVAATIQASQSQPTKPSSQQPTKPPSQLPTKTITPPTQTPSLPPTSTIGVLGQRAESAGIGLTVITVSTSQNGTLIQPKAGNIFLNVEVLIENIGRSESTPYNPLYFKVKDSDGFEYNISFETPDPGLTSGDLTQGDKVRGFVSFEIKGSAHDLIISYEPMVIFGDYKPIRISLGR